MNTDISPPIMQAPVDEFETRFHPRGLTTRQRNLLVHKTGGPEDSQDPEILKKLIGKLSYLLEKSQEEMQRLKDENSKYIKKIEEQMRLIKTMEDEYDELESENDELQSKLTALEEATGYSDAPP